MTFGFGRIVLWNALDIYNIKMIMTSEDTIAIMIIRYLMLSTGAYETVK